MDHATYEKMLSVVLNEARLGRAEGGIPIGAAIKVIEHRLGQPSLCQLS